MDDLFLSSSFFFKKNKKGGGGSHGQDSSSRILATHSGWPRSTIRMRSFRRQQTSRQRRMSNRWMNTRRCTRGAWSIRRHSGARSRRRCVRVFLLHTRRGELTRPDAGARTDSTPRLCRGTGHARYLFRRVAPRVPHTPSCARSPHCPLFMPWLRAVSLEQGVDHAREAQLRSVQGQGQHRMVFGR